MFDIKDFYLSISKELLSDVLTFAETIIYLDNHVRRLNTAPINRYFSIRKNVDEKKEVTCLTHQWMPTMAQRYMNL